MKYIEINKKTKDELIDLLKDLKNTILVWGLIT